MIALAVSLWRNRRSLPPPGGVFQLPPVMGTLQRFDQGSGEMRQLTGPVLAPNSSSSSLLMNAPLGGVSSSLLLPQQQQQQQLLPLMSFGPPFLMQPTAPSSMPLPASVSNSLAHLQQHHQQQQQVQLQQQQREGNHNNHGGHTHAIQLQTSLEMAPVVCPALCEIRTQLQELTRSVESCQNEVSSQTLASFRSQFLCPSFMSGNTLPCCAVDRWATWNGTCPPCGTTWNRFTTSRKTLTICEIASTNYKSRIGVGSWDCSNRYPDFSMPVDANSFPNSNYYNIFFTANQSMLNIF